MSRPQPKTANSRPLWGVKHVRCLWHGIARHPEIAFDAMRGLGLRRDTWRRFSLKIHGRDFLSDLYAASREIGISPFLMWGTLLGCVREGGFLANDLDLDVGILYSDYLKKDALVSAMEQRGYIVRYDAPHKLSLVRPDHFLKLDIDVFYPWNGRMICAAMHHGRVIGASFPPNAFDEFQEVRFVEDLIVLIPASPERALESAYGDWRTPAPKYDSSGDLLNRLRLAPDQPVPELPRPAP